MAFELRLILAILTLYRLARMIAKDDGPLFIFKRARYWVKDRAWHEAGYINMLESESGARTINGKKVATISDRHVGKWYNLAEGLSCPYCVGIWLSLPLFGLILWPTYYGDLFLTLMAISGGQAFLQSLDRD